MKLTRDINLILVHWRMKKTKNKTSIRWNAFSQLENRQFADDIGLISEKRQYMLKTEKLVRQARKIGLIANAQKTKIIKITTKRNGSIYHRRNK